MSALSLRYLGLALLVLFPGLAFGQARVGSQLQVNELGSGWNSAVAVDADGDALVVWESFDSAGADHDDLSIQGRRIDSAGVVQGSQFQVNVRKTGRQRDAEVDAAADGGFVVTWVDEIDPQNPYLVVQTIEARRHSTAGLPTGAQILVRDPPALGDSAAVAVEADGDFVVSWGEGSGFGFFTQVQRFAANGAKLGGPLEASDTFFGKTDIGSDADGDFVVVWQALGGQEIRAQRYTAGGSEVGAEIEVAATTTGVQSDPVVAVAPSGAFVVVWVSDDSAGDDADGTSIQAQRYDATGATVGGELQVNTVTAGDQDQPAVSIAANGDFVIAWTSDTSGADDDDSGSIQARRYLADGTAVGAEVQVNTVTASVQDAPAVASEVLGDFIITWRSFDPGVAHTVEAQRYSPAVLESPAELTCDDVFDNDSDGATDCQDLDCDGQGACEFGTEQSCADAVDNDGDYDSDCSDADCDSIGFCEHGAEQSCADANDNDGDGDPDCADLDCDSVGTCEHGAELSCADTADNDADGLTDCQDPDCAGIGICDGPYESTCDDGADNDGDELVDCGDPDCALDCGLPALSPAALLALTSVLGAAGALGLWSGAGARLRRRRRR